MNPIDPELRKQREREKACATATRLRETSGLTQSELARAAGLPLATIQGYESGQTKPTRRRLEHLARAAGIPLRLVELSATPGARLPEGRERAEGRLRPWGGSGSSLDLSGLGLGSRFRFGSGLSIDPDDLGTEEGLGLPDPARPPRPPEAPALDWNVYDRVSKALSDHAEGDDRAAAASLSSLSLFLLGGETKGARFVIELLRSAFWVAAEDQEEALSHLPILRSSAEGLPPPGEGLRLRWVEARVRSLSPGGGRGAAGLAALQRELADLEMGFESVCVWADLAALDLEAGRPEDALGRLREIEWARASPGVGPGVEEALRTVEALVRRGGATPRTLRRLVAHLLGGQVRRGAPFRP